MASVYLETSALLAWLLGEPASDGVAATLDDAESVVTSVLTLLEAQRGLLRAEQLGRLTATDRAELLGTLASTHPQWMLMELSRPVRGRAAQPFPLEPVRTLDAIHLSTMLAFQRAFTDLTVLRFDRRVRANATALGFETAIS